MITAEEARSVADFMHLTPAEGGWRVAIVDSVDDLNPTSMNALLKILEEPPKRAVLLLIYHGAGRILPTIRSRCRRCRNKSESPTFSTKPTPSAANGKRQITFLTNTRIRCFAICSDILTKTL